VFAGTISTAQHLSRLLTIPEPEGDAAFTRQQLCEQLQALEVPQHSKGDMEVLVGLVSRGVAFYCSKLPSDAKNLVARGFKAGS
jgi:hypothetical protein